MPRHAISLSSMADWVSLLSAVPVRGERRAPEAPGWLPVWARSLVAEPTSIWSDRSHASILSHRSVASIASAFSFGSVMSAGSLLSAGSLASIASSGSLFSIASSGSIFSIASSGGCFQIGGHRSESATQPDPVATEATVRKLSGLLALAAIASAPLGRRVAA